MARLELTDSWLGKHARDAITFVCAAADADENTDSSVPAMLGEQSDASGGRRTMRRRGRSEWSVVREHMLRNFSTTKRAAKRLGATDIKLVDAVATRKRDDRVRKVEPPRKREQASRADAIVVKKEPK